MLVVGDVMLDRYWWGIVGRISPEAPVPVVALDRSSLVAGGAANVAANIISLGGEVRLIGVIGDDDEGLQLRDLIEGAVGKTDLLADPDRGTTTKTRIIAHNQHVARIDREDCRAIGAELAEPLTERFAELLEGSDIVILSDYAKGTITNEISTRLITMSNKKRVRVVVDPKGEDFTKYSGAFAVTPNEVEAYAACDRRFKGNSKLVETGRRLLAAGLFENVLITRGGSGMLVVGRDGASEKIRATNRNVYDVTGAGDTVVATLGLALAAGADFKSAANLANLAAGNVVEKVGTSTISKTELDNEVRRYSEARAANP